MYWNRVSYFLSWKCIGSKGCQQFRTSLFPRKYQWILVSTFARQLRFHPVFTLENGQYHIDLLPACNWSFNWEQSWIYNWYRIYIYTIYTYIARPSFFILQWFCRSKMKINFVLIVVLVRHLTGGTTQIWENSFSCDRKQYVVHIYIIHYIHAYKHI